MKLNVQERLVLTRVIPEKGTFETMDTIEKLKKTLFLSEEEVEEFELKQTDTTISWNSKGAEEKEIELSVKGKALLLAALEKLSDSKELDFSQYLVLKKFKEETE